MSRKRKELSVKVGDIVLIDLPHYFDNAHMRDFKAKVTAVRDRLSIAPLVSYERLDGIKEDSPIRGAASVCDVSFVKKVITPVPYVCVPQLRENIFVYERNLVGRHGGLRTGSLDSLVMEALASVRHVDLSYSLHEERIEELYKRACWPGRVATTDLQEEQWGWITVRWKTFERWVHQNAARLILTKSEAWADAIAFAKKMDEDLMRDMDYYVDQMREEDEDHFLSLEDQMLTEGDEYYEDRHWND